MSLKFLMFLSEISEKFHCLIEIDATVSSRQQEKGLLQDFVRKPVDQGLGLNQLFKERHRVLVISSSAVPSAIHLGRDRHAGPAPVGRFGMPPTIFGIGAVAPFFSAKKLL